MQSPRPRKQLPRAVIAIAVLITGVLTAWALSATQLAGPHTSWHQAEEGIEQVWGDGTSLASGQAGVVGNVGAQPSGPAGAVHPVAWRQTAPTITYGQRMPHGDRGACTNCHLVLDLAARPVPRILSNQPMPHANRGPCRNCHFVDPAPALSANPVAATRMGSVGSTAPVPVPPIQPAVPNEAEWRGLEVRPGARGVVVTKAEGAAGRAGLLPGDGIASVNGLAVQSMRDFVAITRDGQLPQGTVIVRRDGQRLAFELAQTGAPPMMSPGTAGMAAAGGPMVPGGDAARRGAWGG